MKPLFEVQYQESKAMLLRAYSRGFRTRMIGTFVIIAIAALLVTLAWSKYSSVMQWVLITVYALAILWELLLPLRAAGRQLRGKSRDAALLVTLRFTDEIRYTDALGSKTIPFSKIKRVHVSREYVVLSSDQYGNLVVPADSFTTGSFGEFAKFARENCALPEMPAWEKK